MELLCLGRCARVARCRSSRVLLCCSGAAVDGNWAQRVPCMQGGCCPGQRDPTVRAREDAKRPAVCPIARRQWCSVFWMYSHVPSARLALAVRVCSDAIPPRPSGHRPQPRAQHRVRALLACVLRFCVAANCADLTAAHHRGFVRASRAWAEEVALGSSAVSRFQPESASSLPCLACSSYVAPMWYMPTPNWGSG